MMMTKQGEMTIGDYTRKMLQVVVSKEYYKNDDVYNIIKNLNEEAEKRIFMRQMLKKTQRVSHFNWLYLILEKYEKKYCSTNYSTSTIVDKSGQVIEWKEFKYEQRFKQVYRDTKFSDSQKLMILRMKCQEIQRQ